MELRLHDINKSFDKHHVLRGISFTARGGAAFGLLGRNGSGKTTTLRIIMNIFLPDSGGVYIDGKARADSSASISYLPEERGLYPKRLVSDQMLYFGRLRGLSASDTRGEAQRMLKILDAEEYWNRRLDTLSKGNQQKIQFAITLLGDPDIIILDEPFSGLDPVNAQTMKHVVSDLSSRGKIVVFSSHEMSTVETFCDDICIINKGTIALTGNLPDIKRTYPRNKIFLLPDYGQDFEDFAKRLKVLDDLRGLVLKIVVERSGVIVYLREESGKDRLLRILVQHDIGLSSFAVLEPTLEEIFVEKAGDGNGTV
ncbi:MAG: ATP-binding cassette domain-containing protein [Defluviitaleaceae bacterium]|nr:ATP-binding cassette domain-containing protein [Defluviitaleaceae bacterium]